MQKTPMTAHGATILRQELEKLKNIDRPNISKAIGEARALGDLRENADYHAAKEAQGLTEARIRDIEGKLSNANIIDVTRIPKNGIVVFGTTVQVENLDTGAISTYMLVGDDEADLKTGKISINSPIARALVGKKVGDIAQATVPTGIIELEITQIDYSAT